MNTRTFLAFGFGLALSLSASAALAQQLPCQNQYREGYSNFVNAPNGYGRSDASAVASTGLAALGMVFQHRETVTCQANNTQVVNRGLDLEQQQQLLDYRLREQELKLREQGISSGSSGTCIPTRDSLTGYRCF